MKFTNESFTYGGQPYMNEPEYYLQETGDKLTYMKPQDYMKQCSEMMGISVELLLSSRKYDDESYYYIEQAALNKQLTIPIIDYKKNIQNGLHRVIWAEKQGIELVPVFVYR